ncbi:WbqC family protein, partial [Paraglaciecola arctica]|uniref:WbqC family protein n=1 Tax=Paraglaciecola arctica TaxID=1128911 RepID=UPI000587B936
YIKRGWINKNRIVHNGNIINITLPVQKTSQNRKINEHLITNDVRALAKIKKQIQLAYCKAPNFNAIFPLVSKIIDYPEENIANYLTHALIEIASYLGMNTKFILSSELSKNDDWGNAQDRIIDLTKKLGGTEYFNLPGGKALYNEEDFSEQNLILKFITPKLQTYKQLNTETFIPGMSIIDYLMSSDPIFNKIS